MFKNRSRTTPKDRIAMPWKTLYVTGRPGFDIELIGKLGGSAEDFLTGSFNSEGTYLFWVTENFDLRKLKSLLGAKAIFRFRIRFFPAIDAFTAYTEKDHATHRFTPAEEQMFRDLNAPVHPGETK